ncbi:MAG TPA: hypothetical protein PLU24_05555, partial [Candidatus Omnitrophota bacterium]|nr:hypothetical protein [Candidatus Omnitrophota bacterium]
MPDRQGIQIMKENVLIAMLKFPPDFTGAGSRILALYSNMQKKGKVGDVFVLTSTQRDIFSIDYSLDGVSVYSAGKNDIPAQRSFFNRLKKIFNTFRSGLLLSIRYFKEYKRYSIVH